MIITVYIIRKGRTKFLIIESNGNITWTNNLDDADLYKTPEEAINIVKQKKLEDSDIYIDQIPYSTFQRKSKKTIKPKSKRKKRCKK